MTKLAFALVLALAAAPAAAQAPQSYGQTVTLAVDSGGESVALRNPGAAGLPALIVFNDGAQELFWATGLGSAAAAVASSTPLAPYTSVCVAPGNADTIAGITASGATSLHAIAASACDPSMLPSRGAVATPAAALLPAGKYSAVAGNTPATLTGAQMAGASLVDIDMTAVLAGAGTLNTASAAAIVAAIPSPFVGQTYLLKVANTSSGAFAWTLTAGAGVTVTGTATINQATFREFLVTLTSLTAVAIQATGVTGTAS
jgi:hypothetical protein